MSSEKEQFAKFLEKFRLDCKKAGRKPSEVQILPVSKGQSVHKIRKFLKLEGFPQELAENYAEEMATKVPEFLESPIKWHYQGALQSRKIPEILKYANVIQSVSRLKELQIIAKVKADCEFFIQLNISTEDQKLGASEAEAKSMIEFSQKQKLKLIGFMGVATDLSLSTEIKVRKQFATLREFRDANFPAGKLSMGMSSDYHLALKEGANIIRVGSSIFGERVYS